MKITRTLPSILAVGVFGVTAATLSETKTEDGFPKINAGKAAKGRDIPAALGTNLPAVAAHYGKTQKELTDLCHRDHSLRADKGGRLFYACPGPLPGAQAGAAASAGQGVAAASIPESQTFLLHSKPGATRTIYLDFDGHTATGTLWNGGASIVTPAYNVDATEGFSSPELANIQNIWQRVSEDFAALDVNVTTQDPGVEGLRKSPSTDTSYGIRVCIGGSCFDWYGAGAGGVAYVGSFSWSTDTPCYTFVVELGGDNKYIAEAASHEAGHTLGLSHDGQLDDPNTASVETTEYYAGHANWAPIMGVGYYNEVTQFSKGDYAFPSNTQDDLQVMQSHVPLATDEHGDAITNATSLPGSSVSTSGVISTRGDADVFQITTDTGVISLTATPDSISPNLDINLAIYSGSGDLLASANPSQMGATLNTTLPAGTYYVAIDGIGTGLPATGYDDYGSLGNYTLTGDLIGNTNVPPVAVASNSTPSSGYGPLTVAFSSAGSTDPDGSIAAYDWDFGDGTSSTAANPSHTYTATGTYTASLVVYDNGGLSSSDTVIITVTPDNRIYVSSITMTTSTNKSGTLATAAVTIKNANGTVKSGATVSGRWSGATTGTVSGTTSSTGRVSLNSARTKTGTTFTFTVTGVTAPGNVYAPALNTVTSASKTK